MQLWILRDILEEQDSTSGRKRVNEGREKRKRNDERGPAGERKGRRGKEITEETEGIEKTVLFLANYKTQFKRALRKHAK